MEIEIPYGKSVLSADIPDGRIGAVLTNQLHDYEPPAPADVLVEQALASPIGSLPLCELAKGKENVVILASDHTRPVPSKAIIPAMLREVRRFNPQVKITILIATGCHRGSTRDELVRKFGREVYEQEHIVIHDCLKDTMVDYGILPSGAPLCVNRIGAQADLLIAEGFIEPHFFAGFSGGRKSVLPGICAASTVYANHSSGMIDSPYAHSGCLKGNRIHEDMVEGARRVGLCFIVNVVCNGNKETVAAFAGDFEQAHLAGVSFLNELCRMQVDEEAGIVITGNGGFPLDQNIYQAVKGISTADIICRRGGVIIMAAASVDGHGGNEFHHTFACGKTAGEILQDILSVPQDKTRPDQWQSQILARAMARHPVILISTQPPELVQRMGLIPADNLSQAVEIADGILGTKEKIVVIPDGVGCIPALKET
ncbi:nickel-dependent lactate racemase [Enterocloster citroniae]|uniref:nickel-dependent lactate racemase n=1 Tax=Enterocloster citroniae TaxID=358743 RepID=UPI001D070C6E|nr:nickel-dependent lactate racemase [Enterocloster citroniae]MCB7063997.1 nickel-dependent lactate racemase [Enterocloster citroniae]